MHYEVWAQQLSNDEYKVRFKYNSEPEENTKTLYKADNFFDAVKYIKKVHDFFQKLESVKETIANAEQI